MKLLDTRTGKKIPLQTKKRINMFVCGPTVYDVPHIGNMRTYVAFDIIVRYLRSTGKKVFYLQNITDIDDKIIDRAKKERVHWKEIARKFERIYHEHESALGIASVTKHARATDYIPQIIAQIETLLAKKHAYRIEGDGYYFDISTFADYGKLSRRTVAQAQDSLSRVDESVHKKNRGDFALWKFPKHNDPSWDTKLGPGRPGWHIEDTAISEHHFGPQYDIHGGSVNLKFPHHEAEIAQQEASSGKKPFVKTWLHTGSLNMDGKKMSKSVGNVVTADQFLREHSADVFRYIVCAHHYRSPIDYTAQLVDQARQSLSALEHTIWKLGLVARHGALTKTTLSLATRSQRAFTRAMEDDCNTPKALATLFETINSLEGRLFELSKKDAEHIQLFLLKNLHVLGFGTKKSPPVPLKIRALAAARDVMRRNQQFIQSDTLREKISALGYTVEDTPAGSFVYRNESSR